MKRLLLVSFVSSALMLNACTLKLGNKATIRNAQFTSEGEKVVGNLYFPDNYNPEKKYSAIIVSGSWTTVKEQMAGLYAQKLAKEGFITIAYDPRNFGESGGQVRFYENPRQKIEDISNAVTYL